MNIIFNSWAKQVAEKGENITEKSILGQKISLLENKYAQRSIVGILGWNGIILTDQKINPFELFRNFIARVQSESCGKCSPCRVGTRVILDILNGIALGKGETFHIEVIERVGRWLASSSMCGLGITTAKPVLDFVENFKALLEKAIKEGIKPSDDIEFISLTTAPCQQRCPIHQAIPDYIDAIADGRHFQSLNHIWKTNPIPSIVGRVCPHPCESECTRNDIHQPLAICALKRFAADREVERASLGQGQIFKPNINPRLPRIAVIGAGPAGLTVAYDLATLGYPVTIFEKYNVFAGTCWFGIPEYRLPREVILRDVQRILDLGVEIRLNSPIGPEYPLSRLKEEGFSVVFFGIGALAGKKLAVPGEDEYQGCIDCVEYLRMINLEGHKKLGDKVIIIGGGNSAMDAARTSIRLGCKEVTVVYRRSRAEMPASPWEIEEAMEEGVKFHFLAAPKQILGKNGKVIAMECLKMTLGEPDASGRRRPVPLENSEFIIETDLIIPAVSQSPDIKFLGEDHGLKITRWDSFDVDEDTLETNIKGYFAGGDAVTGPATVVEAIAHGHKAARSIHYFLQNKDPHSAMEINLEKLMQMFTKENKREWAGELPPDKRVPSRITPPEIRKTNFEEFDKGYNSLLAKSEAERCLKCYRVVTFAIRKI